MNIRSEEFFPKGYVNVTDTRNLVVGDELCYLEWIDNRRVSFYPSIKLIEITHTSINGLAMNIKAMWPGNNNPTVNNIHVLVEPDISEANYIWLVKKRMPKNYSGRAYVANF